MLKNRFKSFKFAGKGIRDLFLTAPNARIHLFIAFMVVIAGIVLKINLHEWAIISLAIFVVLAGEAFNSAIEYLTDLVSPEIQPLAGKAKDIAAAAVLLLAIGAIFVGLFIFGPKLLALMT